MELLAEVDMHGIQTSGNCIRNITTDALAGIAPDEDVDPRPYCEILRQWSTLHPEFAFLARKFKIAVTGAREDRAATAWHDIGLQLRKNEQGEIGFRVLVGGGMGRTPMIGTPFSEFIPWQQILVYIEAIVRVYNLHGRRDNLYKARIKILVKAEGQKFVDDVNASRRATADEPASRPAGRVRPCRRRLYRACAAAGCRGGSRQRRSARLPTLARAQRARAQGECLSRRDAVSQARGSAAGRRHGRPDGWRSRPGRPLQRR